MPVVHIFVFSNVTGKYGVIQSVKDCVWDIRYGLLCCTSSVLAAIVRHHRMSMVNTSVSAQAQQGSYCEYLIYLIWIQLVLMQRSP